MTFFLLLLVLFFVALGGFFAGSETGCYRLSRFALRLGVEQRRPFYQLLSDAVQDSHGLVLSLLMGNNLANYFSTSLVAYLFFTHLKNTAMAEVYATIIMTPVLFLYMDILPKSLFYYRADTFMVSLAPLIWFFHKLFTFSGIVPFLKWLSNHLNRLFGSTIDTSRAVDLTQREQIKQIFHETREEGLVSDFQKTMMDRLIRIPDLPVSSVMIAADQVRIVDLHTNRETLLAHFAERPFTRLPVHEQAKSNIIGYIDVYKTLGSQRPFDNLVEFLEPIVTLPVSCPIISALHQMRRRSCAIALVIAAPAALQQKMDWLGIVTIKDLMEEFVGELH
jgi:CBS domain containing-hemolysin-like protein